MEPVKFIDFDKTTGEITVCNKYDFTDLSHLEGTFKIHTLQGILLEGKVDLSEIAPHGCKRITVYDSAESGAWCDEQDIWLTIKVCYKENRSGQRKLIMRLRSIRNVSIKQLERQ